MKIPKTILCPSCTEEIELVREKSSFVAFHDCGSVLRKVFETPRSNPIFPVENEEETEDKED